MKVFNILVSYDIEDSHGNLLTVSELYGEAFDYEKAKHIQSLTMNNLNPLQNVLVLKNIMLVY